MIRKTVAEELKMMESLFDPFYFCSYEEIDLSWRAHLRGHVIIIVPTSIVYHKRGGTFTSREQAPLTFHKTKNKIMTMIKCYETRNVLRYVPIAIAIEIFAGITIMPIQPFHGIARLKGVFWVIRNFRRIYERRKTVQRLRIVSDNEVMRHMERSLLNRWFNLLLRYTHS